MYLHQKIFVAKDKNTPAQVLTALSQDRIVFVRNEVANNTSAPEQVLDYLAKADDWIVRFWVAKNLSTSPDTLVNLIDDIKEDVSLTAAQNPSLPLTRILELALAEYGDEFHRGAVAYNPSLPYENLLLMLSDSNNQVRRCAEEALRERNKSSILT